MARATVRLLPHALHCDDARKHSDHPARRPRRGRQEHDRVRGRRRGVVIDAGLAFPRDEHLGVDLILPDFSYLIDRDRPVRAVLLTHGHEDHVGALPYLLREASVQEIWATRLTLGLIKSKLDEHGLLRAVELREADPEGEPVELGPFRAEFIRDGALDPGRRRDRARDSRRPDPAHGRLQARPHAGRRPAHRRRAARRAREPRRRPPPRRLDERGAAGRAPAPSDSSARPSAS